jgi:RNA polymerase sigma-70 factor, ECF subfamily
MAFSRADLTLSLSTDANRESIVISNIQVLPHEPSALRPATAGPGPVATETSDERLIERIAAGNRLAMHLLYARHHVRIFRFAIRIVHDEGLAEDVVNEVFLKVWRKAGTFAGRSQVSTWLLAITRHKAWEIARRRSTDRLDDDAYEGVADTSDSPESSVCKKQNGSILLDCLSNLPPRQREIIDLVYYHEKSIDEAAAILGVPRNTVKTRMFYARRRLAQLLATKGVHAARTH